MKRKPASPQPDLFENDEPHVVPPPALKTRLAALAIGEVGDDQDHG
jgi:hypothetical protein